MTAQEMKKLVEDHLKRYKALQEQVRAAEDDAANVAFSQGSGDPVQSSTLSDKTFRGALLLETVDQARAWVDCITRSMTWMEENRPDLHRLLDGHYGMRYTRGYRRKHAREFSAAYCTTYHISESEYRTRRVEGLEELTIDATEAGLIGRKIQVRGERKKTVV